MNPRARQTRFEALRELGCVCCAANLELGYHQTCMPVEVHHLNAGGHAGQKRLGDEHTIPLCSWHHRSVLRTGHWTTSMRTVFGPSLAGGSKPFRLTYGDDAALLDRVNQVLRARGITGIYHQEAA